MVFIPQTIAFIVALSFHAVAQQTLVYEAEDRWFRDAYELMEYKLYTSSNHKLENFAENSVDESMLKIEAHYYSAYCALKNKDHDAELKCNTFIKQYPYHPKVLSINFDLGNYNFSQKAYKKALTNFENVNPVFLPEEYQNEYYFKAGYAYLMEKQYEKSVQNFSYVKAKKNSYQASAYYYCGYSHYKLGKYKEALEDFQKANEFDIYKPYTPVMMMGAMYKLKLYGDMIALEKEVLTQQKNIKSADDFFILAAEAHFQQKDYHLAVKSFENSGKQESFSGDTLYKYAYSLYKAEAYDHAIKNLKKLNPTNVYGQYAAYYLGLCYLKKGNKAFAVNAFSQAAKLNYDEKEIKPYALFYAGKTSFDLRMFSDAINFLSEYVKKYPEHPFIQEANELLGDAFLNTSNYSDAIAYIESIKTLSKRLKETYQKVTFYKAMEHFNDGDMDNALIYVNKSLSQPINPKFTQLAYFWKGEALSLKKQYESAIEAYQKMPKEDHLLTLRSYYGLGYAYFNIKKYEKSAEFFKKFIDNSQSKQYQVFYSDAMLRYADVLYALKKYDQAIEWYDQCMANPHTQDHEHAVFQKAIVLWLSGKYDASRETFDFFIRRYPQSRYYDNALYQRGELELERGNYSEAVKCFNQFLEKGRESQVYPYALLKKGIALTNLKNYKEAEICFRFILNEFSQHELALNALQSLQELLNTEGRSDEFEAIFETYKEKNPENKGLESIDYDVIKSNYLAEKYNLVRKNFKEFEKKYPTSSYLDELNFYFAEASYKSKDTAAALEYYRKIIEIGKSNFVNRSIRMCAEIELTQKNYTQALKFYHQLNTRAVNKKELQAAWMGLMETYYNLNQYDSSLIFAKKILNLGNIQLNAVNKSSLFAAKSLLMKKDTLASQEYLLDLLNNAQDEYGAESNYLFALVLYNKKEYKQSLDKLFYLNEKYANYTKWVNQSFLLIAENYIALGELFQARATLSSIVEHAKDKETILKAKKRLADLGEN